MQSGADPRLDVDAARDRKARTALVPPAIQAENLLSDSGLHRGKSGPPEEPRAGWGFAPWGVTSRGL